MNKDIITVYTSDEEKKDYKLLMVINKEFKYLIYTNIENNDVKKDLYAIKIKELKNSEEILPIDENEWERLEKTYQELINK